MDIAFVLLRFLEEQR